MFKKRDEKEIDIGKVNVLVSLAINVLQIMFVMLIVGGVYVGLMLLKEVGVFKFIVTILGLLTPLFIGLVVAWLIDPIVTYLQGKGIRRGFGAAICYIVFILAIFLVVNALVPVLSEQLNDFVSTTVPNVLDTGKTWIDDIFEKFNNIENFDAMAMKNEVFSKIELFATNLTTSLPTILVNAISSFFSGLGTFVIGMIIGFYLLLNFHKNKKTVYDFVPTRFKKDAFDLVATVNVPLRKFVQGSLLDCTFVFVAMLIGFAVVGLKAPLVFALFCGITNIIPYVGPYIGGAPAVLVGFTQSTTTGIIVLIIIAVFQMLEGNLVQPLIMSKTTKLSPITIILGLLVFGHFFGIWGMILATPIIGAVKSIFIFFNDKYRFLEF